MAKYKYYLEIYCLDKWMQIADETRDYCLGYFNASKDQCPRNAIRIRRSDGKILDELKAFDDVCLGMIAGYPTAEQYEFAANRALEKAKIIRERNSKRI